MAVCDILNIRAEKVGEIDLNDLLFNVKNNTGILHEVVCMQRANRRSGNACTKTRGEVSGGGAKPWRQKGTGRARAGSRTSPVWRGGGTVFGPKPRDYSYTMPKKVKRLALKMAMTARKLEGNLVVVVKFELPEAKTKEFVNVINNFQFENCFIVTGELDDNINLSSRNAVAYKVLPVAGLNVYDILNHNKLFITKDAITRIEEVLA